MRAIRSFGRHIRDALRNFFRNGWMTAATIFTMTLTLLMIGGLSVFMVNMDNISQDIESGIKVLAYIDIIAEPEDEAQLRQQIEGLDAVKAVTYQSKEEAYEALVDQMGEDFRVFDEDANPFMNVFHVEVMDTSQLAQVAEEISQMPYVAEASYGAIDTENLLQAMSLVRLILAFVSAVLVVIALLLISNTIRLTIYSRQTEVEIMRLVGAKASYIRAPFILEGILIGVVSACLATGLLSFLYGGLDRASLELFGARIIRFEPLWPMILWVGLGILGIGVLLGALGSRRSLSKLLTQEAETH